MRALILGLALMVAACSGSKDEGKTGQEADTSANNFVFEGGEFQLEVQEVTDACLDGSLNLLFMPNGSDKPYALQNRTYIPATAELPKTYVMALAAPFTNMSITVETAGDYAMKVRDAKQSQVELGLPSGQCTANLNFDADFTLISATEVTMAVTVTLSDFASADNLCPVVDSDPCSVTLDMSGAL
jgi:hypothetical protein